MNEWMDQSINEMSQSRNGTILIPRLEFWIACLGCSRHVNDKVRVSSMRVPMLTSEDCHQRDKNHKEYNKDNPCMVVSRALPCDELN